MDNQCPRTGTKSGARCSKFDNGHTDHHSFISGERWTDEEALNHALECVRIAEHARMSTDRLPSYVGRFWALRLMPSGRYDSVHHFGSEEIRDAWVAMEPQIRVPAGPRHKSVKAWLKQEK